MIGTCGACGTFVRGDACPYCGERRRSALPSAAVLLLGLGALSACVVGQPKYGVTTTDTDTDTADETADTGDTD